MPFNIAGDWIAPKESKEEKSKKNPSSSKPVKVRLLKRGNKLVTVILNLDPEVQNLQELASLFKKKLGVGGAVKDQDIEVQGDKIEEVKKLLSSIGINSN